MTLKSDPIRIHPIFRLHTPYNTRSFLLPLLKYNIKRCECRHLFFLHTLINEEKFINAYGFICFPDKFTTNVFEFSLAAAQSIDFMSVFVMKAACMYIWIMLSQLRWITIKTEDVVSPLVSVQNWIFSRKDKFFCLSGYQNGHIFYNTDREKKTWYRGYQTFPIRNVIIFPFFYYLINHKI